MLHKINEAGDWFAPKRYGYGAGLPIAWQGWMVIAAYVAALAGILLHHAGSPAMTAALVLLVTGVFAVIAARHTRGGWKWRWGDRNRD